MANTPIKIINLDSEIPNPEEEKKIPLQALVKLEEKQPQLKFPYDAYRDTLSFLDKDLIIMKARCLSKYINSIVKGKQFSCLDTVRI